MLKTLRNIIKISQIVMFPFNFKLKNNIFFSFLHFHLKNLLPIHEVFHFDFITKKFQIHEIHQ